jgi:hypothetical protein
VVLHRSVPEKNTLTSTFFFGAKEDLEDLSAYAGGVAEYRRYVGSVGLPPSLKKGIFFTVSPVLLRAKKVGHQISVSFEKFDVVQALLSFF